jgi:small-conductance mechanosensitive channel
MSTPSCRPSLAALAGPVLLAALAAAPASAQEGGPPPGEGEAENAPVAVDGRFLFRVVGFSGLPAPVRAARIAGRIEKVAGDAAFDPATLALVESSEGTRIQAGTSPIMVVTDAEAGLEGIGRALVASTYRDSIREAIGRYRSARTPRALAEAAGWAAGALAALAVFLLLLSRLHRRVEAVLERRVRTHIPSVGLKSFKVIEAERIWSTLRWSLHALRTVLGLVGAVVALEFALDRFPWTRPLARSVLPYIVDPLRAMGRGLLEALPGLLFLAVLALVTRWILKLTRLYFAAIDAGRISPAGFDREWAWPTCRIVRLVVVAFALVVAYPYIPGSGSGAFKGISIFAGVVFSLGSSSAVANIVAGYALIYRRAFRRGDRVKIGETVGDVEEIGVSVTRIRSPKNEEVVIPNSSILNGEVLNYSALARERGLILHTTVGIGYETPWRQVEAMLLLAAERTPGLLRDPPPFVLHKTLGDFCVVYEINAYCDAPRKMASLYTALHRSILDVFNEYGVQIMTPAYEGDPEKPKVVPRGEWYAEPARPPENAGAPGDPPPAAGR